MPLEPEPKPSVPKKRGRFRFSMRAMVILIGLFCVVFAWFGYHLRTSRIEQAVLERLQKKHTRVEVHYGSTKTKLGKQLSTPSDSDWAKKLFGYNLFSRVTKLTIESDASELDLRGLPGLVDFDLHSDSLTSLENVQGLEKLESLGLYCPQVKSVESLPELKELAILDLSGSSVVNANGLEASTKLKQFYAHDSLIEELNGLRNAKELTEVYAPDAIRLRNINGLKGLKKIKKLNFANCEILQSLEPISEMKSLEYLVVHGKSLRVESADLFQSMTNLTDLIIGGCQSWEDVDGFAGLQKLEALSLSKCDSLTNLDGIGDLENLVEINVWGAPVLNDLSGIGRCESLKTVVLENWTPSRPNRCFEQMVGIWDLSLWDCDEVLHLEGIEFIEDLDSLSLIHCDKLENIDSIVGLSELTHLYVRECQGLSKPYLERLLEKMPGVSLRYEPPDTSLKVDRK